MSTQRTAQELADELKQARHEYGKALAGCDSKPIRLARAIDLGKAIDAAIDRLAALASQAEPLNEDDTNMLAEARHVRRYLDGACVPWRDDEGKPLSLVARINVYNERVIRAKKELAESRYRTAQALADKLDAAEAKIEALMAATPAPANNCARNLEWVTNSENQLHACRILARGVRAIYGVHVATGARVEFPSLQHAVEAGFVRANIQKCIAGTRKKHKGYTWHDAAIAAKEQSRG